MHGRCELRRELHSLRYGYTEVQGYGDQLEVRWVLVQRGLQLARTELQHDYESVRAAPLLRGFGQDLRQERGHGLLRCWRRDWR